MTSQGLSGDTRRQTGCLGGTKPMMSQHQEETGRVRAWVQKRLIYFYLTL